MAAKTKKKQCLAEKDDLITLSAAKEEIINLAKDYGGTSPKCRTALLNYLKTLIKDGREKTETLLLKDGSGLKCAARLSSLQDELIGLIHHFALRYIYRVDNPSSAERMAIMAVGGYGRGTLAPGSDIDLLFLLPYKQTPWGESVVEYILYMLWDLGFKVGHATRDIDECIRLSKEDMTIRTANLEARYLWGDKELFDTFQSRFAKEIIKDSAARFIEAKMAERDERHKKSGGTRYLVEPNIKEGKGGLRDLHTLFWIAKYTYSVNSSDELLKKGVFNRDDYKLFKKSGDFLWAVRCHVHYLTGRAEERLSFELQREMAQRLNYKTHGGLLDVERFMKHYFLVARNVGNLTNILSAKLEQMQIKKAPGLNRLMLPFTRRKRPSAMKGNPSFALENKRIIHANEKIFENDPVNFLRVFEVADKTGFNLHPDLLHLMTRSLKLIDRQLRQNEEANEIFLKLLSTKRDPETLLRKMNEAGVLGRFVPDFGKIIAMMQFNMYHHYTVDEHTIRSIGVLSSIECAQKQDEHPLAHKLIHTLDDRLVLYIALFLHDIAKGRPEDHSIAGAKIAKRLGKRFKLTPSQTNTISWLVLEHLTMSVIAQSRDLSDPKTIRDFANIVQTPERLKLLLILTVCDIQAVGPGVWNGWKGQLLRTLYYETQPLLTGGYNALSADKRAKATQNALAEALRGKHKAKGTAYAKRHYPAYLLRTDFESQINHANFILGLKEDQKLATTARTLSFEGVSEFVTYGPDQPNMLSLLAGACSRGGGHIVDAQIFTTRDGFALDIINIKREFEQDEDELRRAKRIIEEIEQALLGKNQKKISGRSLRSVKKSSRAFSVETNIVIDNMLSNRFTVIEASGKDRVGLLHDLAAKIFELNLNISSAHIATFGERAVDVFYVRDLTGNKITSKMRQNTIKKELAKIFKPSTKVARKAL